jgi:hypothetical protein
MANGKLFYIFGYTLPNTGEKCWLKNMQD